MEVEFYININNKILHFVSPDIKPLKDFNLNDCAVKSLDCIYEISIAENIVIITTEEPAFRNGDKMSCEYEECSRECIKAYDWNGNFLWSIDDIIKDIRVPIYGGNLFSVDMLKSECPEINVDESHLFFNVCAAGKRYVVDLTDKKVLYTKPAK